MDSFDHSRFLFGWNETAINPTPQGVQQLQPVFQRRIFILLPIIEPFFALIKNPPITYVMRIDLQLFPLLRRALPTDFRLGHWV